MTRIHIQGPIPEHSLLALPADAAHHVGQVRRMRSGERVTLFNGDGYEAEAIIETVERRSVSVRVAGLQAVDRESALFMQLAQCVSKGDRMDYTIQKAVELGVGAIVPLLSSRSVVKLDDERWEKKQEHWRGVVISACEQSGRNRLPSVAAVQKLDAFLPAAADHLRLVLAPTASVPLKQLPPSSSVTLLVGPEGGLSDDEIARALRAGYTGITLGPRVLRTETAGVAALAALQALWGDLG